jgi:hypothetical protein
MQWEDSGMTLRGWHRRAGKVHGGVDGGGVRGVDGSGVCGIYGFRLQHAVYISRLLWCDKEQAVGVVNWINNVLAVIALVAADFLFPSCLPKNYFLIISVLFKISQIVVFSCMTARKYSWNGGGGRVEGEGREI